jgi:hypothetical protein
MKPTRVILTVFGLLDAVLLGRFLNSVVFSPVDSLPQGLWWFQVLMLLRPFVLLSLGLSALGLALERRWGIILSYVQFPFRFVYVYLSLGFLTMFSRLVGDNSYQSLIVAAMILEGVRLAATILLHVRIAKLSSK